MGFRGQRKGLGETNTKAPGRKEKSKRERLLNLNKEKERKSRGWRMSQRRTTSFDGRLIGPIQ
jgi:hypothetical protein